MAANAPILLAEDDDNDIFFLKRALQTAGLRNPLTVARNGQEAIDYLTRVLNPPPRSKEKTPGLVLLDLKMPLLDGFDVLKWLKSKPELKSMPVVVLSSSAHEADITRARDLGAADYRVKPSEFQNLVKIVRELHSQWLKR